MRITILVIASSGSEIYAEHEKCWRSYATSDPGITVYFLRQREDIEVPRIEGDTLWTPGEERLERVFDKTVAAFQFLDPSSYDYLVRTNLSSVWHFQNLRRSCTYLPPTDVFCGVLGTPGLSGAGMILSPDVVRKLAENSGRVDRGMWDDIDFGKVAELCGIPCTRGYRFDPKSQFDVDRWWNSGYHFYLKDMRDGVRNVANELNVMRYLISKIYRGTKK
jgi:hypothetical protein